MADDLILDIDFDISEAEAKQRKLDAQWEQQKVKIENMKKSLADANGAIERMKAEQQATAEEFKKTNVEAIRLGEIVEKINSGKASTQEIIDAGGVSNVTQQYDTTLQQLDKINAKYDKSALALQKKEVEISKINADLTTEKANLDMIAAKIKKATLGTDEHGESWKSIKSAITKVNKPFDSFNRRVMGLVKRVFIFSVITKALRAIRTSLGELMSADETLGKKLNVLKGNLATIGMTFYQSVKPYIEWLVDKLIYITQLAGAVMAKLLGKDVKQMAEMAQNMSDTADNTEKAAIEAKKATASFDTLQTATNQTATSDSSNSGGSIDTSYMAEIDTSQYDKIIAKLNQILPYITAIGAGLAAWKITKFLSDLGLMTSKMSLAITLLTAGIVLLGGAAINWNDELHNGENTFNSILGTIGTILATIGLIVAGVAAWPVLIVGALTILGMWFDNFKDKVDNWLTKKCPSGINDLLYIVYDAALGVWQFIKNLFIGLKQIITGDWKQGLLTIGIGLLNLLIGAVNVVVDAINFILIPIYKIIEGVGSLIGKNWDGKIKLPRIPYQNVPQLATGAVIPGGKPFMAMLGDQRAGQTNIEAPLDTIVEAVRIAIGEPKFTVEAKGSWAQFIKMLALEIKQEQNRSSVF